MIDGHVRDRTIAVALLRLVMIANIFKLGTTGRLTMLGGIVVAVAVAVAVGGTFDITNTAMTGRAQARLDSDVALLRSDLLALGPPSVSGATLSFGGKAINGDMAVVDRVKTITGSTATVFLGDLRVATNVTKPDGTRAVGTRLAAGPAYDAVLKEGRTYRGEAEILGRSYFTVYEPIRSADRIIGILYVGVLKAEYAAVLDSLVWRSVVIGAATVLAACGILFGAIRVAMRPLRRLRHEMAAIALRTTQQDLRSRCQADLEQALGELRTRLERLGAPSHVGGELRFGDTVLNGNATIVDAILAQTGARATIFLGEERIATSVTTQGGSRATGTKLAAGAAHDEVLSAGRTFRGQADILGEPHLTVYEPIRQGEAVIGILFVGMPTTVMKQVCPSTDPKRRAGDEIAEMAATLETFRAAAADKETAEARMLDDRRDAEDARRAEDAGRIGRAATLRQVMDALTVGLTKLSAGDLTCRIEGDLPEEYRQIRREFDATVAELRATIASVCRSGDLMMQDIAEVAERADDLSKRTEQQAATLEETAAALEEVTVTVGKSAQGARHAGVLVGRARAGAETNGAVVRDAMAAMSGIAGSSREIENIIEVIDEIAFQTNLLALNAGVEAARAGEAGRGFAVVASEVRSLAQRSAAAAKRIEGLIKASTRQVDLGVSLVTRTGEALDQIIADVAEVSAVVGEIAASAAEQASGLQEVSRAVLDLDRNTQQNAGMAEGSRQATEALRELATELVGLMARFDLGEDDPEPGLRRAA